MVQFRIRQRCGLQRNQPALSKYEYALYDLFKHKYDPKGFIMWANAIFLNVKKRVYEIMDVIAFVVLNI